MAIQQSVTLQYLVVTPVGRFTFTVTRDQYGFVSIGNVRRNGVVWNGTHPVEVNTAMEVAVDEVGTIDGSNPVGYLIASNYLSEFAEEGAQAQSNARANLGLTSTATTSLTSLLLKANNLSEISAAGAASQLAARTNLGLGSASTSNAADFLPAVSSINALSDVDLGGALVNGKILKVVGGVITQADEAGGGGFTQEQIEDFVGAMFVNGGGVTWTYDDLNSEISAVISLASTDLSNTANIPLLNANQTFSGSVSFTTQVLNNNSTLAATTAFVRTQINSDIAALTLGTAAQADTGDFLPAISSIDALSDVSLGGALVNNKILKVVGGVITQADETGGGGFTQEEIEDFVGAMFVNGGGVTWTYDDINSEISASISLASTDLSNTANIALLNANQTFSGSTSASTRALGDSSTLLATTAFVQQEINALNLGSAAFSAADDFLPSNASINDLSDVNLGGALVDGKILKVVGGVLTQADDAGQSQKEIEDFVGAMFTNGGGITWTYDDANSQISAVVSISSTDLSDSDNIPLLDADQTFTGEVRATTQPINDNSTILATTAYVESQIDNDIVALDLGSAAQADVADFLASTSGLNDLSDVTIAPTANNQFLVHNGLQFVNRLISSSDLSNGNTLAPLNNPALTGTPTAPTAAPATNNTQIATTQFVQSEITALNLGATYQPLNDRLTEIAGLAPTADNFIAGDGDDFVLKTPAQVRTSLELDTLYQPIDATLTSISVLGTAANKIIYTTDVDTWDEADISAFGQSLIDDADAGTARTTLGLGTAATSDTEAFLASGSGLNNLSDVTITAPPADKQFLVHNGLQFVNRLISSSDLSDSDNLPLLDADQIFIGEVRATTRALADSSTLLATTAFVQQEITALELGTASQAETGEFLPAVSSINALSDVDLGGALVNGKILKVVGGIITQADTADLDTEQVQDLVGALFTDNQAANVGISFSYDDNNALINASVNLSLNDLSDVSLNPTAPNQVLIHNGAANFENRLISSSDLEDSADLALLDSPDLIGIPTAPTAGLGTNNTQIATTEFVQQKITALELGATYQPLNERLTEIAGLAPFDNNFIAGDGNDFVLKTPDQVRTSLELDTLYQPKDATLTSISLLGGGVNKIIYTTAVDTWAETDISDFGRGFINEVDAGTARATLGLDIGVDVQAYDPTLAAISVLGTGANKIIYTTDVDTWAESNIGVFGLSLIEAADAATARTTLELGDAATSDNSDFLASDSGLNDLSDVSVLAPVLLNQVLVYDGNASFSNRTLATTDLSNSDNIPLLDANQTFTGSTRASTQDLADNSTLLATTEFVQQEITALGLGDAAQSDTGDFLSSSIITLAGVPGGVPLANGQTLVYDLANNTFRNKSLSSLDLSDTDNIARLNADQTFTGDVDFFGGVLTADTPALVAIGREVATAAFVRSLIAGAEVVTQLSDLTDALITEPQVGQVLKYTGIANGFENSFLSSADLSDNNDLLKNTSSIDDLSDVDTSTNPPALGQVLTWSAGNVWTPQNAPSTYTDNQAIDAVGAVLEATPHTGISFDHNAILHTITASVNLSSNDLSDVVISAPIEEYQVLIQNNLGNFVNRILSTTDLSDGDLLVLADGAGDVEISGDLSIVGVLSSTSQGHTLADISFNDGQITSASGSISFEDNDLTTTGTLTTHNLVVTGTSTTINTESLSIADPVIHLASNADSAPNATTDAGIFITRGSTEHPAVFYWDEGVDQFFLATAAGANEDTTDFSPLNPITQTLNVSSLRTTTSVLVAVDDPAQLTLSAGEILSNSGTLSFGNSDLTTTGTISAQSPPPLDDSSLLATTEWTRNLSINDFSDVDTSAPSLAGQILAWNGANWIRSSATLDIQSLLDDTILGAGLGVDGSYTAPLVSNYLGTATSLFNADSLLDTQIKSLSDNLDAEILRATGIEANIQSELDDTQEGAGLGANGSYTAPVGSNYLAGATSLFNADTLLDTQIKSLSDNLDAEVLRATGVEGDIQSELNDTQAGAGLNANGTYTADDTSNFIRLATSLFNADTILDTQVKALDDALLNEINRATDVEGDLQTELDTTQFSVGLNADGSLPNYASNNYLVNGSSHHASLSALDIAINAVGGGLAELDDTQLGAGLDTDGSYIVPVGSNYLDTSTSLADATLALDAEIKNTSDLLATSQTSLGLNPDGSRPVYTATNYITDLQSHHAAIGVLDQQIFNTQNELDNTQLDVSSLDTFVSHIMIASGFDGDGDYVPHLLSNYIAGAVGLNDADLILDTQIKTLSDALDAEILRATGIEANIQTELDNTQLSLGLGIDGSRPAYASTHYITDLNDHHIAIGNIDNALANTDTNLSNIQTELDDTQLGAGLDTDGAYIAPLVSNYLAGATSLFNADTLLDTQIKSLSDHLDAEVLRATGVEGDIQSELDDTQLGAGLGIDGSYTPPVGSNYLGIATSLFNADTLLDTQIKTLSDNLDAEVLRATGVEEDIQSELDDTQAGAGLGIDGSYTAPVGSNYLGIATSLFNADTILDTQIKSLSDNLDAEILRATGIEGDIQSELDVTQEGAGLGIDGSYTPPVGSNYLGGAISLSNADFILDSEIQDVVDGLGTASAYDVGTANGQIPVLGATGLPAVSGVSLTALGSIGLHSDVNLAGIVDGNTIFWDETANGGAGGFVVSAPDGGLTADQVRSITATALDNGTHTGVTSLDFSYDDLNNKIDIALSIQTSDLTDVQAAPSIHNQILRYSTDGGLNKLVPTLLGTAADYNVGINPNEILLLSTPTQQNVNAVADLIVFGRVIETIDYGQVSSVFIPSTDYATDWNGTGFNDVVVYSHEDYGVLVS